MKMSFMDPHGGLNWRIWDADVRYDQEMIRYKIQAVCQIDSMVHWKNIRMC